MATLWSYRNMAFGSQLLGRRRVKEALGQVNDIIEGKRAVIFQPCRRQR